MHITLESVQLKNRSQNEPTWLWYIIWAPPTSWRSSNVFGLSVRCFGHSNLVIFNRIFPNFIYGLLPSNPGSSVNMFFFWQMIIKMVDKMATANQFTSIRCCGHSNLVIFNRISLKFHIWFASIKPWFKFEYEFCPTNDNQDGQQNGRHLSVCIHPLLWSL